MKTYTRWLAFLCLAACQADDADSGPGGHAAFVWGWVMKRLPPEDPIIDYCHKIGLQTA